MRDIDLDHDMADEDDEWEERETLERYPWLREGALDDDGEDKRQDEQPQTFEAESELELAGQQGADEVMPNYHYYSELTDEHLPKLDYWRGDSILAARPANAFLETTVGSGRRRMLFGEYWCEGELTLLFADTGLGKSALAVQIACALAGGKPVPPFEMHTAPQRVLYVDFELTNAQFAARYAAEPGSTEIDTGPLFPMNLIRCTAQDDWQLPPDFDDVFSFAVESVITMIEFSKARVVILDNLTCLTANSENSMTARRLMRMLQSVKKKFGVSILALAHTPKLRGGLPMELNQLQGSKMLANFADNIIAMGRSSVSNDLRYLKPLKQRNGRSAFSDRDVVVMRLGKQGRMLGFTFVDIAPESRHLEGNLRGANLKEAIRRDRMTRSVEMANAGDSLREIADKLGVGVSSVIRYLKEHSTETSMFAPPCAACAGANGAAQTSG
ncbi:MAG TPA: AAA family ATPase [Pyrinomonadaceae bacterium]|nr:AAA family ATPase [Pyrinomonadaceae bacterium]